MGGPKENEEHSRVADKPAAVRYSYPWGQAYCAALACWVGLKLGQVPRIPESEIGRRLRITDA